MNWQARLAERRQTFQKRSYGELTKPPKDPFVSFGSKQDRHFQSGETSSAILRAHLLTLAERHSMDVGIVHALPQADVEACTGLPDETLLAYLYTLADDAERRAGRVPEGDTAAVLCRSCGPVYLHPSIAAVLPVVNGWPRALGCPWCFIPKDGRMSIPRPNVTCGTCTHFIPDKINPQGGAGSCKLGITPKRTPLPFTAQYCGRYRPLNRNTENTP